MGRKMEHRMPSYHVLRVASKPLGTPITASGGGGGARDRPLCDTERHSQPSVRSFIVTKNRSLLATISVSPAAKQRSHDLVDPSIKPRVRGFDLAVPCVHLLFAGDVLGLYCMVADKAIIHGGQGAPKSILCLSETLAFHCPHLVYDEYLIRLWC